MPQKTLSTKNRPVFEYHHPAGFTQKVVFVIDTYAVNENLYVGLEEADTGEPFADVTKSFGTSSSFLANIKNTEENAGMAQFLIDNRMGKLLGHMDEEYPLFLFDSSKLAEVDPACQYAKDKNKLK